MMKPLFFLLLSLVINSFARAETPPFKSSGSYEFFPSAGPAVKLEMNGEGDAWTTYSITIGSKPLSVPLPSRLYLLSTLKTGITLDCATYTPEQMMFETNAPSPSPVNPMPQMPGEFKGSLENWNGGIRTSKLCLELKSAFAPLQKGSVDSKIQTTEN